MLFFFFLVALGIWFVFVPRASFLTDFGKLIDHPKITAGFVNTLARRSYLTGQFRGRKIVILLQRKRGKYGRAYLVVSMETSATKTIESYEFLGVRETRDGELALFALEVKHELRLTHQPGCLKVLWEPFSVLFFPGRLDPEKWRDVLAQMHALAGSVEQRAA